MKGGISLKKSHAGRLHKALGVAPTKKIPLATLLKAKRSKSAAVRKEATFAVNARKWKHK